MATVLSPDPVIHTVADLLEQLGVSANRVRLRPPPGLATEQDVLTVRERDRVLCELVDGVLVEKALGFRELVLAVVLARFLGNYVASHGLGVVAGADGILGLAAGLVRIPDVSFIPWDWLPGRRIPSEAIPRLAPALAVEVLSQSNTEAEMTRKVREYFTAGSRLVWLVDPVARTVEVHTAGGESSLLSAEETLDGGEVVPGFSLALSDLFGALESAG